MSHLAISRHLMRKDLRQVLPLVWMTAILGPILYVLIGNLSNGVIYGASFLLGLPGLFAVGAGAILVSQEKELRTLAWLKSLPIDRRELVDSKTKIGLGALGIVWLASAVVFAIPVLATNGAAITNSKEATGEYGEVALVWILYSVFLLLAGLALAWRFSSTMGSLLAMLPIATFPWIVGDSMARVIQWIIGEKDNHDLLFSAMQILSLSVAIGLSLVFGRRWGVQYFEAVTAPREMSLAKRTSPPPSIRWLSLAPQAPDVALVRQYAIQNRWLLAAAAVALMACAIVASIAYPSNDGSIGEQWLVGSIAVSVAAVIALGVYSFQGENTQQRIRFLSDRGVSPTTVWLSRHVIPMLLFALTTLVYVAATLVFVRTTTPWGSLLLTVAGRGLVFLGWQLFVYGVAQWCGQVATGPILCMIGAMFLSGTLSLVGVFYLFGMRAPWMLLCAFAIVPYAASYHRTREWMDGRRGKRYVATHAAWLGLALLIPISPTLLYTLTAERIPRSILTELKERVERRNGKFYPEFNHAFVERDWHAQVDELDNRKPAPTPKELRQWIQQEGSPVDTEYLRSLLTYTKIKLESPDATPAAEEEYRNAIQLVLESAKWLRRSTSLMSQEHADILEIQLLREASRQGAPTRIGDPLYRELGSLLCNTQYRDEGRRVALALAWDEIHATLHSSNQMLSFGSIWVPEHISNKTVVDAAASDRLMDGVVIRMWQILETRDPEQIDSLKNQIAEFWGAPNRFHESSTTSTFWYQLFQFGYLRLPSSEWHGAWEQQAIELFREQR